MGDAMKNVANEFRGRNNARIIRRFAHSGSDQRPAILLSNFRRVELSFSTLIRMRMDTACPAMWFAEVQDRYQDDNFHFPHLRA